MNKITMKLICVGLSLFAFTSVFFLCFENEILNTVVTKKLADDDDEITSEFDKGNSREGIYVLSSDDDEITSEFDKGNSREGIYVLSSDDDEITSEFDKGNSREGIYVLSSNVTNSKFVNVNETIQQI